MKNQGGQSINTNNLDIFRLILDVCQETEVWERLKFEVPAVISGLYKKWRALKLLYETVLTVVLDYNKVIEGKVCK